MFDSFGSGDVRGTQRFVGDVDQLVTFRAVADYDDDFGMRMQAWDAAGHDSSTTQYRGTTAEVRIWADANATIKVLTWPYSNRERDGTDLERGKWVDRYKEADGTYRITVRCDGAATCEAPEGPGTCLRTTRCSTGVRTRGLCPGPADVQCCITPRTIEPDPGSPPDDPSEPADPGEPSEPEPADTPGVDDGAAPACCDDPADGCRWLDDGFCDEGCAFGHDADCDTDEPGSDESEPLDECASDGGWCDCDGYEDCCDFCP